MTIADKLNKRILVSKNVSDKINNIRRQKKLDANNTVLEKLLIKYEKEEKEKI